MVIDISLKGFAIFAAQAIAFVGAATLLGVLFYYTDDPRVKPSKIKNTIYTVLVVALGLLIFRVVEINWLP